MKKKINYDIPAELFNFSTDSVQENFSRCKLKVWYEGETADKRYFSEEFSKQLQTSLPYTPVVAYYDADEDDFIGHATEQQILGIVDPRSEPTFEVDEEGVKWSVCDVVLYTERPDTVGLLAKKVVGHKQSLELNPKTVEYKINYDDHKHLKNLEFTAGSLVGVSVLGNNQRPAFTGSEFFAIKDENKAIFEEKLKKLYDYCDRKDDSQGGDSTMNILEFVKLSWGEKQERVFDALSKSYENDGYAYPLDFFDDEVVCVVYYYTGDKKMLKCKYSLNDDGTVTLGTVSECHIVYEDVEVKEPVVEEPSFETAEEITEQAEETVDSDPKEPVADVNLTHETDESEVVVNETFDSTIEDTEAHITTTYAEETTTEMGNNNEQHTNSVQEESSSTTSFADSEREELETLKREKKINLINSYKEFLSEEEFNNFTNSVDSYTDETLELDLLKIYKKGKENVKTSRAFSLDSMLNRKSDANEMQNFMAGLLNK